MYSIYDKSQDNKMIVDDKSYEYNLYSANERNEEIEKDLIENHHAKLYKRCK